MPFLLYCYFAFKALYKILVRLILTSSAQGPSLSLPGWLMQPYSHLSSNFRHPQPYLSLKVYFTVNFQPIPTLVYFWGSLSSKVLLYLYNLVLLVGKLLDVFVVTDNYIMAGIDSYLNNLNEQTFLKFIFSIASHIIKTNFCHFISKSFSQYSNSMQTFSDVQIQYK